MFKNAQMEILGSYINNDDGPFFKVLLGIFCWIGAIICNIGLYDDGKQTGIILVLNIIWSCLLFFAVLSFIALIYNEQTIINISCHYSKSAKYNDLDIQSRKALLLYTFFAYSFVILSGGIIVYLPILIIKSIGSVFVITIPNMVVNKLIKDEPIKETTNKPMIQKYNEFLDEK